MIKKLSLLAAGMLICAGSVSAASFTASVDDRAEALTAQLKGNNSYQAYLAREFSDVAAEEKSQHDIQVARAFMDKAEEYAAQAGGSQ